MIIRYHRHFRKRLRRLRTGELAKFKARRDLFVRDPFHPLLNNHALRGEYAAYRSIDITGDLRVHYEAIDNDTVMFVIIGTHHELYGK